MKTECLAEALDNEIEWGVWGGMTERERRAVLKKRRGAGSELNPDYFAHSVRYLQEAEKQAAVPTLFGERHHVRVT